MRKGEVMQYVYFGLVPIIVAGLIVYRGWYSYKPGTSVTQLFIIIAFGVTYSFIFGIFAGVGSAVMAAVIANIWGHEIRKDRAREHAKRVAASKSDDTAKQPAKSYEEYTEEIYKSLTK
jgi:hypothetical protein